MGFVLARERQSRSKLCGADSEHARDRYDGKRKPQGKQSTMKRELLGSKPSLSSQLIRLFYAAKK